MKLIERYFLIICTDNPLVSQFLLSDILLVSCLYLDVCLVFTGPCHLSFWYRTTLSSLHAICTVSNLDLAQVVRLGARTGVW